MGKVIQNWYEIGILPTAIIGTYISVFGSPPPEEGWEIEIATRFLYIPKIRKTLVMSQAFYTAETLGIISMEIPLGEKLWARCCNIDEERPEEAPVVVLEGFIE